jgi:hypothetical protein
MQHTTCLHTQVLPVSTHRGTVPRQQGATGESYTLYAHSTLLLQTPLAHAKPSVKAFVRLILLVLVVLVVVLLVQLRSLCRDISLLMASILPYMPASLTFSSMAADVASAAATTASTPSRRSRVASSRAYASAKHVERAPIASGRGGGHVQPNMQTPTQKEGVGCAWGPGAAGWSSPCSNAATAQCLN